MKAEQARMEGRGMRGKKAKCDFCGAPFEARRKNAKHCEACRAAIWRADSHAQYRLKTGKLAREDYRAAVEAEVRADVEERRRRAAANRPRCLYCGNVYGVNSSGYCATCRRTGLDGLHKETGRTNGWDKPATPPRAPIAGGWRGRPIAGGGTLSEIEGLNQ